MAYCGLTQQRAISNAKTATDAFHRRFSMAQDELIYRDTDRAWSSRIDLAAQSRYFSHIRRKMESCAYTGPLNWSAKPSSDGTMVTLTYQALCTNGRMRERFTWRISGGRAFLVSYAATGNLLLTD